MVLPPNRSTSYPCAYDVYCFRKVVLELITGNVHVTGSNDAASDEWLVRTLGYIDANYKECVKYR
jgi:hypothetical protein